MFKRKLLNEYLIVQLGRHEQIAMSCFLKLLVLGLGTEFRSEKIPRNGLGTISVIPRKKAFIPKHSEFQRRANSEARNGTERNEIRRKKLVLQNRQNNLTK
jgi:hypothetical protein